MNEADSLALLLKLYAEQPRSVDKLPYTTEIQEIVRRYNEATALQVDESYVYKNLMTLRKHGLLIKRQRIKKVKND